MSQIVDAPAKLNLYLHILGKLPDGYHELESLVVFTEHCDRLHLAPSSRLTLRVTGAFGDASGDVRENLVMRAADALQQVTGTRRGARMELEKHIPVGAGLGGGSSDAAAALLGLNALWELGMDARGLHSLAKSLGADVAMCLAKHPAIARGIGEQLTPLSAPLPPLSAVLVYPSTPLLTKEVYARLGRVFLPPPATPTLDTSSAEALVRSLKDTRNHLQRPAIELNALVPEALLALETVQPAPLMVRMSGSGACCFGLYNTHENAVRAAGYIQKEHPEWWVMATACRA